MSEFQNPKSDFKIQLNRFKNEFELDNFMFTTGELYFVNKNFI